MFTKILKAGDSKRMKANENGVFTTTLCSQCEHLNRNTGVTCKAFPDGIPVAIMLMKWDHHYPFDFDGVSDGGVVFSRRLTND